MEQVYTRKSLRNSLTNTEKTIVENIKSVVENKENKNDERLKKLAKNWDKLVYTFCILLIYLNYGLCSNLFPPAMVDMKFLYHTSMAKINYGYTFNSAGYIAGSLTGFLYKYINRQLSFTLSVVLLGVFIATEPIWTSLWQFYAAMFLSSFGGGVWDSGNSVWVVEMWKEKGAAPVLNLSQMMFGIGSIIGPLLMKPFIYGDLSNKTEPISGTTLAMSVTTLPTTLTTSLMNNTIDEDPNYSVDRRSKLKVPFFVGGGLTLTIPVLLLVMFFIKRYKIPERQTQTPSEKIESNLAITGNPTQPVVELSPGTRKVLIALVALSLNSYSGLEMTFFNYSSTYYQYLPIKLSAPTAAEVMAYMTVTYALGRGVSAFISSRLRAEVMITYHLIVLLISYAILYFGQNSETLIYTGNVLIGFGFSAMWPAYYAFSEKHMKLTDKVTSIYSIVSGLFPLGMPFIIGPLIEEHPEVFLEVEIGLFFTVIFLFIIIMVIVKRAQRYPISYTVN